MIKWITNSKARKTNKSSKYKGIRFNRGYYSPYISVSSRDYNGKRNQKTHVIGYYKTEKEALDARMKFILDLF